MRLEENHQVELDEEGKRHEQEILEIEAQLVDERLRLKQIELWVQNDLFNNFLNSAFIPLLDQLRRRNRSAKAASHNSNHRL